MSNTVYIGYTFIVNPLQPASEILIAELGFAGFESFVETESGVLAYIQKSDWFDTILDEVQILNSKEFEISFSFEDIAQRNWNEEWEKGFNPIIVDDIVTVRAPFHDSLKTEYDVLIEPKMSFGTGHHETTHMMIQHIIKNDFKGKKVLDMGCGTGVLAILAEKVGASSIDAIDIDHWCYMNSLENVQRNYCDNISVFEGDASLLIDKSYDIILANINRNSLINDMSTFAEVLNQGGLLFLSGFYKEDIPLIVAECERFMLKLDETLQRGQWVSLKFLN